MRGRNKKENIIMILLLLIVGLGIGYALISTDLTINGVGKFNNQSWDVHFEDLTLNPNNVTLSQGDVAASLNHTTMTDITFTVTLQEPGDFYEFEVTAVNNGSLDAMIGLITNNLNSNPISAQNPVPTYARYTATYSDGIAIAPNHLLGAGYSETYKVRLEYRTDIDAEDLPDTVQTLTFNFGVQYVQADANAIPKPLPSFADDSWETIIHNIKSGNTSFYHVGDTKTVELGNSLGTHTIRIANTSTPTECGATGFSQSACGFVLEFADIITTHVMNPSGEYKGTTYNSGWNVDGWPASSMYAYLNDTNDSTSIINSLPAVLKNAIIDTTVISGHGSTSGETNFTSTDKLYLLSTKEVYGKEGTSNVIDDDTAETETRQLDYYQAQGVTTANYLGAIKQRNGSNYFWWLRSAYSTNTYYFLNVISTGVWNYNYANNTSGVSPAFRIG